MTGSTYIALLAVLALTITMARASDLGTMMDGCNDCHGNDGVSQWSDIPTIAGLAEFVHVDALYRYQEEARPCSDSEYRQGDAGRPPTNMCAIAADLSEDDIDALAAVYAELPYVKATQDFDAELAIAGKALHDEHCDTCHSDEGTNPDDEAGMLGGQQMGYLETAFEQYAAGTRAQPARMQRKMDALSDDDVVALIHYYGSVQ